MTWFVLSISAVLALALAELTQQHILHTKKNFDEFTSGVLSFLLQGILIIPFILLSPARNEFFILFDLTILPWFILVSTLSTLAMISYLRSFKVENISISTLFISTSIIFSTILGIVFFTESISPIKFIGLSLVLVGIFNLSYKNIQIELNHFYGLLAGFIFGIVFFLDKKIVLDIHPYVYIFWLFLLISIFGFLFRPKKVIKEIKNSKVEEYKPVIISAIAYLLFNIFTFYSYRMGGEVGKVDAINNSQIFIIILVEYFIFKQKGQILKKLISATLAFIGVFILGFY